jgi:hypothetical protein
MGQKKNTKQGVFLVPFLKATKNYKRIKKWCWGVGEVFAWKPRPKRI